MVLFSKTAHIQIIEEIAKGMKAAGMNKRYLELGIAKARCFNRVAPYFEHSVAVDINENASKYIKLPAWGNFVGTTDDYFNIRKVHTKFNLIFIDTNHDIEHVKKDFINSWGVLDDNGIIILHDTYPPNDEYLEHCKDAWKIHNMIHSCVYNMKDFGNTSAISLMEFPVENWADVITLPFFYGLTIVRKYKKHLHWVK